jgi:dephospho-CoA kinase
MKVIGLTGGIASGKSTVARILRELGVRVLDADQISREVMSPGRPAYRAIAGRWPQVLLPDGAIDRAKLGAIVFADETQRRELTGQVVPRIVAEIERRTHEIAAQGVAACVLEAATLFEERLERLVDGVLLVSVPPEEQVRRLVSRSGLSEKEARARLAAQLPLEEKLARSRWVLDNSGPERDLAARVRAVWEKICREVC